MAEVPLDGAARSFMESRFGVAFHDVRIHSDAWAAAAARTLGARAFTLGNDIFFAEGQYAPESAAGLRLLAHELVHVVQQSGIRAGAYQVCASVGDPADPLEAEAECVAGQVCEGTGPISSIHPDPVPVIRRVVQVDAASVSMSVDPGVFKAKPAVDFVSPFGRSVAIAHLTEGINLGKAATGGSLVDIVDNPVVKMTGKFDLILGPGDNTTDYKFGLMQMGTVFNLEDTYVGRTKNEGHVIMHHRNKIKQGFLLDSVTGFDLLCSIAPAFVVESKGALDIHHMTCDLGIMPGKKGDSPGAMSKGVVTNLKQSVYNFLFELRCDLGFYTVLVVIDPKKRVLALSHVTWHLVWHFRFKWRGGQSPTPTATAIVSRADFGTPVKGAPTEPGVAALVATPTGPFMNDVMAAAQTATYGATHDPDAEYNDDWPSRVPSDFFI